MYKYIKNERKIWDQNDLIGKYFVGFGQISEEALKISGFNYWHDFFLISK